MMEIRLFSKIRNKRKLPLAQETESRVYKNISRTNNPTGLESSCKRILRKPKLYYHLQETGSDI